MSTFVHPSPPGYPARFVAALLERALALRPGPVVYAISGLQGSGKSTLAAQLAAAAQAAGEVAVALSIDDFYLDRPERLELGRSHHPLLATRGPPGSHDVALACHTLDALRSLGPGGEVALPGFDKIDDVRLPRASWRLQRQRPRLIVFEGWFLGVPAEPEAALGPALNRLEREEDPTGAWRRYCNHALAGYAPLWSRLDHLLFLQPPGFGIIPEWRWQQEQSLQTANPGRRTMDRAQVERFVAFFERVSRQALRTLPAVATETIAIDRFRNPGPFPAR